jgi:sugar/nucleoside kinase (ribokinase family)
VNTRVAIVGYASMDHSMECDEFRAASGTTLIRRRLSDPWPGIGGMAHAARGLAAAGHEVHAVTWVGTDEPGKEYIDRLSSFGVNVSGVSTDSSRTPSCYLFYGPDGETVVVYDAGDRTHGTLTETQREIVAECDWVCLMVGPRPATLEVLDLLSDNQHLGWGVKGDPDAYSPGVVHRILSRASVVSFSARERVFLDRVVAPRTLLERTRPDALLAETHGPAGVRIWRGDFHDMVPCTEIDAVDTTGAGDMFFAGAVASLIVAPDATRLAAERGVEAATSLLLERMPSRG